MDMFVYGDEGMADKDQEMTKRWRNFKKFGKNRNVLCAEQQQQK